MSKIGDVIRDISEWEQEAARIVRSVEEEAQRILRETTDEAQSKKAAARAECAAEGETLLRSAEEEGRREAGRIAREAEDELKEIRSGLDARRPEAVGLILEELRAVYGGR